MTTLLAAVFICAIYFISNRVQAEIEEKTNDQMFASAESYGNKLSIDMNANLTLVKNLSTQSVKLRAMSRKSINLLYKQLLVSNPGYNGIYIMFEPNAFDGKDAAFKNDHESASNMLGLFEPYWQWINGQAVPKVIDDDESGQDYYALPKRAMKTQIIEPYFDQGLLMTSYVSPIIDESRFIGIVGLDIAISDINKEVQNTKLLSTGYFSIISKTGIVIADHFSKGLGERKISKLAEELEQPQLADILAKVQSGTPGFIDYFDKRLNKDMRLYYKKFGYADWGILAVVPQEEIFAAVKKTTHTIIFIGLISIFLASLFVYYFASNFTKPILQLSHAAGRIMNNDYSTSVSITTGDELEGLGNVFNNMTANISSSFEEVKRQSEAAQKSAEEAEVAKAKAQKQSEYLANSTKVILSEMDKFSQGDLTVHLSVQGTDDISKLFSGFNATVEKINALLHRVQDAVEATSSASTEISSSSEEMAAGSQETSAQMNDVASAVEEMTRTIYEMTQNAANASATANSSGKIASDGGKVVNETIEGMNRIAVVVEESAKTVFKLGQNSEKIGEIVQVIEDIADQTNLLALNAAIEAARAGEQGRGFAVVADEVRKLAERTTKATSEIGQMIKSIQADTLEAVQSMKKGTEQVNNGKILAVKAGEVLEQIVTGSKDLTTVVSRVAESSDELNIVAGEIGKNIESINTVTHESASGLQQIAKAAEDLNRLTDSLQGLVATFRTSTRNYYNRLT
ncbi:MAG: methyl-accepting chemotaxis protein [Ignavibacteria bacterium]|nr:methyl-accepting chemotaxis protein [Ignavibacteria bacterium]